MKKVNISVLYDEEKMSALKLYLEQKSNTKITDELEKALDTLYSKTVPISVRSFIEMRAKESDLPTSKSRRTKTNETTDT